MKFQINNNLVNPICYTDSTICFDYTNIQMTVQKMMTQFFSGHEIISGRPEIVFKSNPDVSVIITTTCYSRLTHSAFPTEKLQGLQYEISSIIKIPVVINLIILSEPYLDATSLARYLSDELQDGQFNNVVNQMINIVSTVPTTISTEFMPSLLVGLKVQLSGRLKNEKTRPRMTKQMIQKGSFTLSEKTHMTVGSYTGYNKKGSYTVRVWLNHLILVPLRVSLNKIDKIKGRYSTLDFFN